MREWSPTARVVTFVVCLVLAILASIGIVLLLVVRSVTTSADACGTVDGIAPQVLSWVTETGQWHRSDPFEVTADHPRIRVDSVVLGSDNAPIFPETVGIYAVRAGTPLAALETKTSTGGSTPAPPRTDIVLIGSGVHGVNAERVLTKGRWELLSDGEASDTSVRPCG
jgi:hypothetical protein